MSKLSKFLRKTGKSIEKGISNVIPHQHSADRRAANQAVAEQISFYQTSRDLLQNEAKRVDEERTQEKQKIGRKQIRSARNAYRAPGFLEDTSTGYKQTLG